MDARKAFEVLRNRASFSEDEAHELAAAFGCVWNGPTNYIMRSGEKCYTRQALESYFKGAVRCRPLGAIQTR